MKYFIILIFSVMILAQWFVPVSMIYEQESVLKNGKEFKFKTAPVDPTDPFRGKYITLNYELTFYKINDPTNWMPGATVFVSIYDSAGLATIKSVSHTKPNNPDFIKSTVTYINNDILYFDYPFDRYYLEEAKAPAAEKLYREMNRDTQVDVFVVVAVKDGVATLKDVTINGMSINEAAANYPN